MKATILRIGKRALPLAIAFTFVLSLTAASDQAVAAYSTADLEAQAKASLEDGYRLLIDPSIDAAGLRLVGTVNEGDRATLDVAGRLAEIARFRSALASYGSRYIGATVTLTSAKVQVNGTQLLLSVIEDTTITFELIGRGPRPEDVTRQRIPHEFTFVYSVGTWTLAFDRPTFAASSASPDQLPAQQPTLSHAQPQLRAGSVGKVLAKPLGAYGTYRWLDAVYYAHQYAFQYNSAYWAYPNDCADFMSQALRAGGWTDINGAESDPNVWWYNLTLMSNSNTWSAADWLVNFVYVSGRGYSLSAFTDLYLGDLMFADWAHNGTPGVPEHTMMLTYKTSDNYTDIRFTYHTTDRYDYPLSSILASNPTPSNLYWGSRIQYNSN